MLPAHTGPDPRLAPFAPAATRALRVFGAEVQLVLVPERKARPDRANPARPAFVRSPAARIVRDEALWQQDGFALTPNRYPFAAQQRLLWPTQPQREPDQRFWLLANEWATQNGGAALHNQVGAAATIARCHAHLVPERLPFLAALPERRVDLDLGPLPVAVSLWQKEVPACLLGVRGPAAARAEALVLLAEARLSATCSIVVQDDTAWLLPRSLETPNPHFPYALGAAELWGRWCFVDAEVFAAATGAELERALVLAGMPPLPPAVDTRHGA